MAYLLLPFLQVDGALNNTIILVCLGSCGHNKVAILLLFDFLVVIKFRKVLVALWPLLEKSRDHHDEAGILIPDHVPEATIRSEKEIERKKEKER